MEKSIQKRSSTAWLRLSEWRLRARLVTQCDSFGRRSCVTPVSKPSSVSNGQFVAQKVVATDSVDGSFVPPSSAAHLTVSRLKMRGDRPGEFVAQIKIPANALCISAIKPEQGLGMSHVDGIPPLRFPRRRSGERQ